MALRDYYNLKPASHRSGAALRDYYFSEARTNPQHPPPPHTVIVRRPQGILKMRAFKKYFVDVRDLWNLTPPPWNNQFQMWEMMLFWK